MPGSKPGGPQSKKLTPRYGRGRGYGGPAQGASDAPESIQTAAPFAAQAGPGRGHLGAWGQRKEELAQKVMDRWETILDQSDSEQNVIAAGDKIMDRVLGKAKQTVENMGETTMIIKTGVPRADRD